MVMDWEVFRGGPTLPKRDRLHVTLNPRGAILINHKVFEAMGRPEAALLLYDERRQTIGVQPAAAGTEYSFPLKQKDNVTHRTIYAWPFCKFHKLKPSRTVVFGNAEFDHDGILLLDLHRATEVNSRQ
jgi:hypothetical protein